MYNFNYLKSATIICNIKKVFIPGDINCPRSSGSTLTNYNFSYSNKMSSNN